MLQIAICDDNLKDQEILREMLVEICKDIKVEMESTFFTTSESIIESICTLPNKYDLYMLDMYIDEKTGIDIAKIIRQKNNHCAILFITAFSDKMIECFSFKASAYLMKPYQIDALKEAIRVGIEHLGMRPRFEVCLKSSHFFIFYDEILYVESNLKKMFIHQDNKQNPIIQLQKTEDFSPPLECFFVCHKSYIVNFNYVDCFDKVKHEFVMRNGDRIPISRPYYAKMKECFLKFHKTRW